ncbi:hypothetical protein [Wukongibacter sp. M2B1]|uniref:hypothetical protein n=1 Tax=Wukongibacter sp. M2B1 TaxID=3088895 RepID=UPI003D7A8A3F
MKAAKEILYKVERGELTSKKASEILRSLPLENRNIKYAKKIKIKIYSKEENIRINLPAIPIWLIEKLAFIAVKFSRHFSERGNEDGAKTNEKKTPGKWRTNEIDVKDVKRIFSVLRFIPPCKLVEVDDNDSFVEIYTI